MNRRVEHVTQVMQGYLATPMNMDILRLFTYRPDDIHDDHPYGWSEYAYWGGDTYPEWLNEMATAGIAFSWEFDCTEDFHYGAYNFPTEDSPNNLVIWDSTMKRRAKPRKSKKFIKQVSDISAANELLYQLGIKNGSN